MLGAGADTKFAIFMDYYSDYMTYIEPVLADFCPTNGNEDYFYCSFIFYWWGTGVRESW